MVAHGVVLALVLLRVGVHALGTEAGKEGGKVSVAKGKAGCAWTNG